MIRISDCLPTSLSECPQAIRDIIGTSQTIGFDPNYEKFKTQFSFLVRRLWTYSIVKDKSLLMAYSTDIDTKFIGIKIENGKEYIAELNAPFPLSYLEMAEGIDIIAKKFNAVYCLKLIKHLSA